MKKLKTNKVQVESDEVQVIDRAGEHPPVFVPSPSSGRVRSVGDVSDIAEAIKELNIDEIDSATGMSSIDQRANLSSISLKAVLRMETLVGMKFLPIQAQVFARKVKRNSASLGGLGRKQIVEIMVGEAEKKKAAAGMMRGGPNQMGGV